MRSMCVSNDLDSSMRIVVLFLRVIILDATATAPTLSLCLVPPAAPVLPVSGYAYVAPVPNRVYHCRYVAGSWVFRVRILDTVQLENEYFVTGNIGRRYRCNRNYVYLCSMEKGSR